MEQSSMKTEKFKNKKINDQTREQTINLTFPSLQSIGTSYSPKLYKFIHQRTGALQNGTMGIKHRLTN